MKKALLLSALSAVVLSLAVPVAAQTRDQEAAFFLGYSYMNFEVEEEDGNRGGSHGVTADYTYLMDRRFGFVVSAAVNWGSADSKTNPFEITGTDVRQSTFLVGPHATLWRTLTSEFGIRALAGAAWRTREGSNTGIEIGDEWGFAAGANAHLDFRLSDHIWLRAIQPGVEWTRFNDRWQMNWRISAGFVLQAGEILQ
ncbi:MAG: outer membrane beta-barrel protein [Acidobacteria bacterium]|nr:outer membrane beta-barrel protein [Acidobacteriota bacterium]